VSTRYSCPVVEPVSILLAYNGITDILYSQTICHDVGGKLRKKTDRAGSSSGEQQRLAFRESLACRSRCLASSPYGSASDPRDYPPFNNVLAVSLVESTPGRTLARGRGANVSHRRPSVPPYAVAEVPGSINPIHMRNHHRDAIMGCEARTAWLLCGLLLATVGAQVRARR
jgi:hypothetical protein